MSEGFYLVGLWFSAYQVTHQIDLSPYLSTKTSNENYLFLFLEFRLTW